MDKKKRKFKGKYRMIIHLKDGFHIYSHDKKKHLGGPYSKQEAEKRLKQIEYFKYMKEDIDMDINEGVTTRVRIDWTFNGNPYTKSFQTKDDALKRLKKLEDLESDNKKNAPTDSGMSRAFSQAEAKAIKKALKESLDEGNVTISPEDAKKTGNKCPKCGANFGKDVEDGKTKCTQCGKLKESNVSKLLSILESTGKVVTIEKSQGEYRVPAEDGYEDGAHYTDDKEDAVSVAKKVFGDDVIIKFRSITEFVGGKYEKYRPK